MQARCPSEPSVGKMHHPHHWAEPWGRSSFQAVRDQTFLPHSDSGLNPGIKPGFMRGLACSGNAIADCAKDLTRCTFDPSFGQHSTESLMANIWEVRLVFNSTEAQACENLHLPFCWGLHLTHLSASLRRSELHVPFDRINFAL